MSITITEQNASDALYEQATAHERIAEDQRAEAALEEERAARWEEAREMERVAEEARGAELWAEREAALAAERAERELEEEYLSEQRRRMELRSARDADLAADRAERTAPAAEPPEEELVASWPLRVVEVSPPPSLDALRADWLRAREAAQEAQNRLLKAEPLAQMAGLLQELLAAQRARALWAYQCPALEYPPAWGAALVEVGRLSEGHLSERAHSLRAAVDALDKALGRARQEEETARAALEAALSAALSEVQTPVYRRGEW